MSIMLAELYDAFKDAGASEEKARRAAEAVAAYDNSLAEIRSDLRMLKWQVGIQAGIILLIGAPAVWLLVRVAAKVGAIG